MPANRTAEIANVLAILRADFAKVQSGRVVKLSDAQRKPAGAGWGAVNTSNTRIGSHAYLDGGTVYLR